MVYESHKGGGMKPPKRHPNASQPHGQAAGGKDRALANALLRMSEKTEKQEQKKADDVINCGDEEQLHGWTNAIPNPRYSGSKRPKNKKKKSYKKTKKDNEGLMWGMTGMTSSAVDEQNAYATLRDMYDSYKKSKQYENLTKKHKLVDPETYQYVPWEERAANDDESRAKLPSISKLRGAPPSKLMEVLEKYMKRGEATHPDAEEASIAASDVLDYYDRYKWNFAKEKQKLTKNKKEKRAVEAIHIPLLTSERRENVEPNAKEKIVRYVNGAVHRKKQNKSLYKDGKNAFYIRIHDGDSNPQLPSMVRLERKKENQNKSDRWVARVIIKQEDESGADWFRPYKDSESSSSVIIVPDTRWKRKLGVVEGERERIQKEMEKIRFQQQQQQKLNKMKKRLLRDHNDVIDKKYRMKRINATQQRLLPPMFSLVEAAKVSMKYDVKTSTRKGVVREPPTNEPPTSYLSRVGIPPLKAIERPPSVIEEKTLKLGVPSVMQILPSEDSTGETKNKDEKWRGGRLFLKRGVAVKEKPAQKNSVRLPVLPKRAKIESVKTESKKKPRDEEITTANATDNKSSGNENIRHLPLVSGASATFQAVLDSTHDSDTSNDMILNAEEITKLPTEVTKINEKKLVKNAEFFRYKVIPQPGVKTTSETPGNLERKPLHPPHTKNRGQERIQDLIGQEKGVVNSVINQVTKKLGKSLRLQEVAGNPEDNFKSALSSAMAKSNSIEENKHNQIPSSIVDGTRKDGVVIKRRVVPPILNTPAAAPTTDTSHTDLPIVSNFPPNSGDDTTNSQDSVPVTSRSKEEQSNNRLRARATKRTKKLTSHRPANKANHVTIDDIILSGDVIIKQRPTPKLLENTFAASISSVKPTRRIVNIAPQRLVQKG